MLAFDSSPSTDLGAAEPNELVRRAQSGCADSFAELSQRYRPRLLNLLRGRLRGRDCDAEDVAQEALARAFLRLDRFDPQYQFSTWLYTIAIRMAHDHRRKGSRQPPQVALDAAQWQALDASPPQQLVQRQEEVANVWETAKRVLSAAQYTAMWLRYGEELSPVEVAQVMQRTRIGVRVLLHRARTILVARLAEPTPPTAAARPPRRKEESDASHHR